MFNISMNSIKTRINISKRPRIRILVSKLKEMSVSLFTFNKILFENYCRMQTNLQHLMNSKYISTLSIEGVTSIYSLPGVSL